MLLVATVAGWGGQSSPVVPLHPKRGSHLTTVARLPADGDLVCHVFHSSTEKKKENVAFLEPRRLLCLSPPSLSPRLKLWLLKLLSCPNRYNLCRLFLSLASLYFFSLSLCLSLQMERTSSFAIYMWGDTVCPWCTVTCNPEHSVINSSGLKHKLLSQGFKCGFYSFNVDISIFPFSLRLVLFLMLLSLSPSLSLSFALIDKSWVCQ